MIVKYKLLSNKERKYRRDCAAPINTRDVNLLYINIPKFFYDYSQNNSGFPLLILIIFTRLGLSDVLRISEWSTLDDWWMIKKI